MARAEQKAPAEREGWWSTQHRKRVGSQCRWIDLDQIYYAQPDDNAKVPCLLVETITVSNASNLNVDFIRNERRIHWHKRAVYVDIARSLGIPAYVLWYSPGVESFYVRELGDWESEIENLGSWAAYESFIDSHLRDVFEGEGF